MPSSAQLPFALAVSLLFFLQQGLKANMKRLYQLITEPQFARCTKPSKYKKLLFALCFFHSVLLERKKFLQLGWNIVYGFNDSDFEVMWQIPSGWRCRGTKESNTLISHSCLALPFALHSQLMPDRFPSSLPHRPTSTSRCLRTSSACTWMNMKTRPGMPSST